MVKGGRQRSKVFFTALGVALVLVAVALQVSWVALNWRAGVLLISGVLLFGLIITGVVLNTIFLIREIRRNEQHDAFINSVTHELKTPVASMRLYLQTLQTREIDPVKRREFYDIMLADSDRLMNTIEQVLRAARTSQTKQLNRSNVDLRALVQECVQLVRLRHHLPPDAVQYTDAVYNPTVSGDLEELKAAISNLLDNAVKYSGQRVRIMVELVQHEASRLAVRVKDEGAGIPPSELKRIFKRFYRIPNTMALRVKGTGLGLFIVRSVAERHGGRAWAESEGSDRGSTFVLEIPSGRP
ncbi:MAG TPA: HAMP domain-containing sensor histidine kinase [Bryobacteraceae bacterium]|nr:HAMP domain-containing sensor histidine kinase [Bryobacteraceae bacterium]